MTLDVRNAFVIVTLDVRIAFNSASCSSILTTMEVMAIQVYIRRLIGNYHSGKTLTCDTSRTEDVPQGSVLDPLLWNITVYLDYLCRWGPR